ncbi:hypothetical protein [Bacillus atrophaeus]|uniref:hypothetical protein n=1 Tax=Bacillus atrophaeus TaxID=1452 RepID=UPI0037C003B8
MKYGFAYKNGKLVNIFCGKEELYNELKAFLEALLNKRAFIHELNKQTKTNRIKIKILQTKIADDVRLIQLIFLA